MVKKLKICDMGGEILRRDLWRFEWAECDGRAWKQGRAINLCG